VISPTIANNVDTNAIVPLRTLVDDYVAILASRVKVSLFVCLHQIGDARYILSTSTASESIANLQYKGKQINNTWAISFLKTMTFAACH